MLRLSSVPVLFLAAVSLVAVACSSGDAGDGDQAGQRQTTDSNTKKAGKTSPSASAAPSAAPSSAPPGAKIGDGATCGKKANHEECIDCCFGGKEANPVKVDKDTFDKCICDAAKKACPAECAKDYCSTDGTSSASSDNDPCASCQVDFEACDAQAQKACSADPTCAAADKCVKDAKCQDLPDGPDEASSSGSSSDAPVGSDN